MKAAFKRGAALVLALLLVLPLLQGRARAADNDLQAALSDTAGYLCTAVAEPHVGSIGGEWAVLGLARSGYAVPAGYFQDYYARVEACVREKEGVLHTRKYTEYSRVIVALSAIGKDARSVAGYDLTYPLGDYEKTIWQGINGPVWALIALDSADYPMPVNAGAATQATRQMYVERILECQLEDGGWSLQGSGGADPDLTGMALQALAKYRAQPAVERAVERALTCLSALQQQDGGYSSWGSANSESCAQVLVALCELGISLEDARFVKDGHTVLSALLTYYRPGSGFLHTAEGGGSSLMATEQGLYALAAAARAGRGENSLYRMTDALVLPDAPEAGKGTGLPGKHEDVRALPVTDPGKTFSDIDGLEAQTAIEILAARGILTGSGGRFEPEREMNRAEFAAMMVRGLGLTPAWTEVYADVPEGRWFSAYVGTASSYGIINGFTLDGIKQFAPTAVISRQDAAVMLARTARLCGLDTARTAGEVRDTLSQFGDYTKTASWAREGLAFCFDSGIMDDAALNIEPDRPVLRGEMARMLWQLLSLAELL